MKYIGMILLLGLMVVSCDKCSYEVITGGMPTPAVTPDGIKILTRGPLKVSGNKFLDRDGKPVFLLGATICCEDAKNLGWPFIHASILETFNDVKANYVHIRTGPFTNSEGPEFVAYKVVNGKVDLNQWDPNFWGKLRTIIYQASLQGVYVEVDLIDAWVLERAELTPWSKNNNIQGVDVGNCDILAQAPGAVHEKWIRKIAAETGEFDNVLYQVGNETFDCNGKVKDHWEHGVAVIMRDELTKNDYAIKPIGTNSHKSGIEDAEWIDYINKHSKEVPSVRAKPVMVNEYDSAFISNIGPSGFDRLIRLAGSKGISYHLWKGDLSNEDFNKYLLKILAYRDGLGSSEIPSNTECLPKPPALSLFKIYIHTPGNPNVLDAEPQVCNSEYCSSVGYAGRSCCPLRQEGDPMRIVCEQLVMGSKTPIWSSPTGNEMKPWGQNPWLSYFYGSGRAKACSALVPAVCSEISVP